MYNFSTTSKKIGTILSLIFHLIKLARPGGKKRLLATVAFDLYYLLHPLAL